MIDSSLDETMLTFDPTWLDDNGFLTRIPAEFYPKRGRSVGWMHGIDTNGNRHLLIFTVYPDGKVVQELMRKMNATISHSKIHVTSESQPIDALYERVFDLDSRKEKLFLRRETVNVRHQVPSNLVPVTAGHWHQRFADDWENLYRQMLTFDGILPVHTWMSRSARFSNGQSEAWWTAPVPAHWQEELVDFRFRRSQWATATGELYSQLRLRCIHESESVDPDLRDYGLQLGDYSLPPFAAFTREKLHPTSTTSAVIRSAMNGILRGYRPEHATAEPGKESRIKPPLAKLIDGTELQKEIVTVMHRIRTTRYENLQVFQKEHGATGGVFDHPASR